MTIPLRDGPTTTELSEAALLLALSTVLTPEQIGSWLTVALQTQALMDANPGKPLGFKLNHIARPEGNGLVTP